jgi:hypothetical protein
MNAVVLGYHWSFLSGQQLNYPLSRELAYRLPSTLKKASSGVVYVNDLGPNTKSDRNVAEAAVMRCP